MTALRERHRLFDRLRVIDKDRPNGRKTTRKRGPAQNRPHPLWTLSIVLIGYSVRSDKTYGLVGIERPSDDRIVVNGRNKEWVIGQARAFLRKAGIPRHRGVLIKHDEPGPTVSGPIRKGHERTVWIDSGTYYLEKDEAGVIGMRFLPLFAGVE